MLKGPWWSMKVRPVDKPPTLLFLLSQFLGELGLRPHLTLAPAGRLRPALLALTKELPLLYSLF